MNNTFIDVRSHVVLHTPAHYTAQQIAEAHSVSDVTVRTRWFGWLCKVAPAALLKTESGYSELANTLFAEFAQVHKKERTAWVADAKSRYSSEWASAGLIEGELMPETVGSTLALMQNHNSDIELLLREKLAEVELFADQVAIAESNFSAAEIQSFQAAGLQRGLQRYQIETQAEIDTVNALRKRRMEGGKS